MAKEGKLPKDVFDQLVEEFTGEFEDSIEKGDHASFNYKGAEAEKLKLHAVASVLSSVLETIIEAVEGGEDIADSLGDMYHMLAGKPGNMFELFRVQITDVNKREEAAQLIGEENIGKALELVNSKDYPAKGAAAKNLKDGVLGLVALLPPAVQKKIGFKPAATP